MTAKRSENLLNKYLFEVRRIEEHRSEKADREIRKLYKQLLKDLNQFIGEIYTEYAVKDVLNYGLLARHGMNARLLEEIGRHVSGIAPKVQQQIRSVVEDTYEICYNGMSNAVLFASGSNKMLRAALEPIRAAPSEVIKRAVENPVSKLTLTSTLENHRNEIVYNIKKHIAMGISQGDTYTTMARRIAKSVDGDYKKSMAIIRTETHRVREAGKHDSAARLDETLKKNGYRMTKTWRTMKDERVRPNSRYKTKRGWKSGKKGKYDHQKMDGVTIPVDEEFTLPSGAKTTAPGQSGVAGEDINCRCILEYKLQVQQNDVTIEEKELYQPDCELGQKFGQDYYDDMHQKVMNCPNQNARKVWKKYEAQVQVGDANYYGNDYHQTGKIYVNGGRDRTGSRWSAPYQTTFHESGHCIDYLAKDKGNGVGFHFSSRYKDGLFPGTIQAEAKSLIDTLDKKLKAEFKANKGNVQWLRDNDYLNRLYEQELYQYAVEHGCTIEDLLTGKVKGSDLKYYLPKYTKDRAYKALQKEIRNLSEMSRADLSDILEGATGARVECGFGHGAKYWKDRKYGGVNGGLATEAFAEMMDSTFACQESLEAIKKYLPKSYQVFEEMLEFLAKEG